MYALRSAQDQNTCIQVKSMQTIHSCFCVKPILIIHFVMTKAIKSKSYLLTVIFNWPV